MAPLKPEIDGVAKLHNTRDQPKQEYNVSKLQSLAEGRILPVKANTANAQVLYNRQEPGKNAETATPNKSQPIQPQSKPQAAPVEEKDTDMKEPDSEPPSPVNVNDPLEEEVLVNLKKLSNGQDKDRELNVWSCLG
ncbi:unnamed protein product [Penicillium salamii]|nr:unnamed protein product [Penicillium salamii]